MDTTGKYVVETSSQLPAARKEINIYSRTTKESQGQHEVTKLEYDRNPSECEWSMIQQ